MRRNDSIDFVFQLASLVVALIIVHAIYVTVVRPKADLFTAEQSSRMAADPEYVQERSVWVIVRDFEQEACFVLMLWAIAIMASKGITTARESKLLEGDLVPTAEGMRILPEDSREYARQIEALSLGKRRLLLPRALLAALHRFGATGSIQDASDTARSTAETESERLDSELAMVRYIAWAIPSIGFIGTVRGIGTALGQAHRAVEGDITGVTRNLGVAFNSTFIALLISIVLMFLLHQLQLRQERLVLDTESYVDTHLIRHLQAGVAGVGQRGVS
ncbi:MAG: MotA/TolQ/ExbB proton channel family protein [bacterium]|nr:MotA/TolQ/ExbB proton channel family protein [bacterium]